jgi:Mor family transcriptional regulator
MIIELYVGILLPPTPVTKLTPTKCDRNEEIRARHRAGEAISTLAEAFGLTPQRVYQIVQGRRK